jgi:integrase
MATKRAKKQTAQAVDKKGKDFLTEGEMKHLLDAAKGGRYGQRDFLMLLMTYRHELRVSELIDLRLKDIDLDTSRLFFRRKKDNLSTHQPIEGDELRALPKRDYLVIYSALDVFESYPEHCEWKIRFTIYHLPTP